VSSSDICTTVLHEVLLRNTLTTCPFCSIYEVADADPIGKDFPRTCVLTLAKELSEGGQLRANEIFADIEQKAIDDMKLMTGGVEMMRFLRDNGLKRAVLTRNLEKNVVYMLRMYLDELNLNEDGVAVEDALFHPIIARDTVAHPDATEPLKAKPNPDGILHVCSIWGCSPSEVIMVGDSANDDIAAANRAGCGGAVLLTQPGGKQLDTDSGYAVGDTEEEIRERTPSLRVESLLDLKECLEMLLEYQENKVERNDKGGLEFSTSGYSITIPSTGAKGV
jgi:phosphoglycolate phosphatase-like HAD superfamily hydrolase